MTNFEKLTTLIKRNAVQSMPEWNGITHYIVRITPTLAREMIAFNVVNNRNKKRASLNTYSSEMLRGGWVYAGDPIRYDTNGNMIDGQHRLTSIISAGELDPDHFVDNMVIFGLSPAVKAVIDSGVKRGAQDQLTMILNTKNASLISSALKHLLVYDAGLTFKSSLRHPEVCTTPIIVDWAESHPDEIEFVQSIAGTIPKTYLLPAVSAAAALVFARRDAGAAAEFFRRLADGAGLENGSPILALRERAIRNRMNKTPDTKRDQLGLLFKAWNHWRNGETLKLMKIPVGGFTERNFPEPI